jgi:hypothetical protein
MSSNDHIKGHLLIFFIKKNQKGVVEDGLLSSACVGTSMATKSFKDASSTSDYLSPYLLVD